uniref:hypothetical protein n=1 Tax=Trichocoleus desertorum TaxID=1481672 RepID=UPI0025B6090F|nr:hypothetical protein [Trichocoleus desertorum]
MDLFNFPDTASFDDLFRLEDARIERLQVFLELSPDAVLFLDPYLVLVISGGAEVASLNPELAHMHAWLVLGTESIALYSDNTRIYKGAVPQGISRQALADLESGVSASAEVNEMVATLEKTLDVTAAPGPTKGAVPILKNLRRIADKTGLTERTIAEEMWSLNLTAFLDEETGSYKAPAADIEKWADRWSLQFAKKQRQWLLQEEEAGVAAEPVTNGKVEAGETEGLGDDSGDDEPTLIEAGGTDTPTNANLPALRFTPRKPTPTDGYTAKAFRSTLDNALAALAKGADEQFVLCAAIANPNEDELGTAVLDKVLSIYGADKLKAKGDKIRKGITTAAIQWMSEQKKAEPAAAT